MSKRQKNRKTILLLAIAMFWVAYVGVVSAEYYFNITSRVDRVIQDRKKDVDFVLEFSANMIIKDNIDSLAERLKHAREFRMVDFYLLQRKDKVVTFYNKQNNPDEFSHAYSDLNQFVEGSDVTFKTIQIYDYHLTVGVNTAKKSLMRVALGEQKYLMLHNLAIVTIFAAVLFFSIYRDAVSFTKLRGLQKTEPEAPLKSVAAGSHAPKVLKESHSNLPAAILFEIKNNTFAPATFESTVVRVDLSHDTQTSLGKSEHLTAILNRYFVAAHELIGRYGGLHYQTIGSELVFHFKGVRKAVEPMGVACVRSFFELAEEIEKTLPTGAGSAFRLKASVASGTVHFTKVEGGFNLSGLPFVSSAQALAQVQTQKQNTLVLSESCKEYVSRICSLESFSDEYAMVSEFAPQDLLFEKNKVEYCTYYRSDLNLMSLLKYMEKLVDEQQDDLYFRIFGDLKHVKAHIICSDLEKSFTHFLEMVYRKSHDKPVDPKVLSAAVSLTQNLIPPGKGSEKLTEILKLYLQFADARVQANAVSVLGEIPSNIRFLKKFIHSDHNRVSADALVVTGKQVVDKELVTRVQSLLRSSDKVHQASGRYVALKLVEHYKQSDMLYYNTNPHLKKLEELLGKAA
ncbi:hypothetical protein [Bdellovibrio sp. HCB337]|uniref:hypothetical protein n=1 Tax=Bdellovibrio sp. HCB337 TaxID=3394358 RepID=UPI0039A73F45